MKELLTALQQNAARVEEEIVQDLDRLAVSHEPRLLDVLRYSLIGGGKRVRPFLVIMAATLCGNRGDCCPLAIALEYLHGASLIHDDVIDNSAVRRGKPTVQKQFGLTEAILAGDFLLAHAMEIVAKYTGRKGLASFNQAARGMVDGEFWQLRNATDFDLSGKNYREAVMRKTGLLIAAACEIGGLWAEAKEDELAALRRYGEGLGFAFQVIDDLLDYNGDPVRTGKAVGNDLQEGKVTLPLILAIEHADTADRRRLREIVQDEELRKTKEAFTEVVRLIQKNKGFYLASHRAETAVKEGIVALEIFTSPTADKTKTVLAELGEFVLKREK